MQHGIIKKYLSFYLAVILITFITLGVVLLLVSSKYFEKSKKAELKLNFEAAISETQQYFNEQNYTFSYLKDVYMTLSSKISGDLFLCDSKGSIIISTNIFIKDDKNFSRYISAVSQKPDYSFDLIDGVYDENCYIAKAWIEYNATKYYLIMTSPDTEQVIFSNEVFFIFVLSSAIVAGILIVVIYLSMNRIFKPIIKICTAAKKYAKGDYSHKINIKDDNTEISDLAYALNDMAESLSRTENMRKSFVANVSHELRTPMTSISGFVDGILDGTVPEKEHRNYLLIVSEEMKRLSRLVGTMLNMAKIESGEIRLGYKTFNIVDMTVKCVLTFEKNISKKRIDIRGLDTKKIMVYADEDLIYQVIYNLIENAIKFCNEGGYIGFTYTDNHDQFRFSIMNSGEGLDEREIPLIFERFYKTDTSRGLDKSGLGLGLYIASTIVNLHQGEIRATSPKGQYTEFSFTLPITKNNNLRGRKLE